MKLNAEPFEKIERGEKTIELRLYDEKRRTVKKGDYIEFSCTGVGYKLKAQVCGLYRFCNFKDMYYALPPDKIGYHEASAADYRDMYKYYSAEDIDRYGVLGIELAKVTKNPKLYRYYRIKTNNIRKI